MSSWREKATYECAASDPQADPFNASGVGSRGRVSYYHLGGARSGTWYVYGPVFGNFSGVGPNHWHAGNRATRLLDAIRHRPTGRTSDGGGINQSAAPTARRSALCPAAIAKPAASASLPRCNPDPLKYVG